MTPVHPGKVSTSWAGFEELAFMIPPIESLFGAPQNPLGVGIGSPYPLSDSMNCFSNPRTAVTLTAITLMMASCAPQPSETHQEKTINPMPEIWQSITKDISKLEQSRAPRKEWDRKVESSQVIHDTNELSAALAKSGLSSSDRSETTLRFNDAETVMHYGFEGNLHALVFFKNDTPFLIKQW